MRQVIAPVVAVAGFLYFVFAELIYKYQVSSCRVADYCGVSRLKRVEFDRSAQVQVVVGAGGCKGRSPCVGSFIMDLKFIFCLGLL